MMADPAAAVPASNARRLQFLAMVSSYSRLVSGGVFAHPNFRRKQAASPRKSEADAVRVDVSRPLWIDRSQGNPPNPISALALEIRRRDCAADFPRLTSRGHQ